MPLTTDWITIGTAGPTVDGRKISEHMLLEAAESYDPDEYEAVISSDHLLWYYGNFGRVSEIRSSTDKKDRTVLQAKIQPNRRLIEMNANGQRLHTSMELTDNFAGTGKAYLMGLAVTDEPASVGTSSLHFSKSKPFELFISKDQELIQLSDTAQPVKQEDKFFQRFKQILFKEITHPDDHNEDNDMNDEQFNTLKNLGEKQIETVEKLNNALEDKFSSATSSVKPETSYETSNETTVNKPEENKVIAAVEKISERLTAVETQLSKAVAGKPATEKPAETGAGEDTMFV